MSVGPATSATDNAAPFPPTTPQFGELSPETVRQMKRFRPEYVISACEILSNPKNKKALDWLRERHQLAIAQRSLAALPVKEEPEEDLWNQTWYGQVPNPDLDLPS